MLNYCCNVKYLTSRNCFLALSEENLRKLSYNKIVKLQYGSNEMYFSCVQNPRIRDNRTIGFPSNYAQILGINEGDEVYINDVLRLPMLGQISVAPLTFEDYEVLESASARVQETMLDQIKVVNKDQKIVIWISKWLYASVYISDVDSYQAGCLANLTEVHITEIYKDPTKFIDKMDNKKESANVREETKKTETKKQEPKKDETKPVIEPKQTSKELDTLNSYMYVKKSIVYRVHPFPLPEKLETTDGIVSQPFNVFLYKKDVPSFIKDDYKEVMLCNLKKIDEPIDYREQNDSEQKNSLIVRLCVVDEYKFSNEVAKCFINRNFCKKYPVIFISETLMSSFNILIGAKVSLGNSFEYQSQVISVEITTPNKKIFNLNQQFRLFMAERVKYGKCVMNSDICVELQPNVPCCLSFYPKSNYFLFDDNLLRKLKIHENEEKKVVYVKSEMNNKLIDRNEVLDCDSFDKIIKRAETTLCLRNSVENVFIVGKPGCGKSTIVRILCQNLIDHPLYVHVVYVSCKKFKGKTVENLYKLFLQEFQNMIYYQPSVLVLDDLHIICGKSEAATEVQTQESLYFNRVSEMLSELIELCQRNNQISVIATCESIMKINDNILSSRGKHLFKNVFTIPELTKKERGSFLHDLFTCKSEIDEDEIDFDELSVKTEGFVIQDLADFVTKSVFESIKRDPKNNQSKPIVISEDINIAYKNSVELALRDVQLHSPGDKSFRDVGGLEDIKKILVESMRWPAQYPGLFANAPLRLQSGVLLYGPPGVGKTLLVGATAKQCGLRLITVKGPELLSKYVGASEQSVRAIFEKAQSARPCILFFDEFDSLAPRRGHDSTGVTDRVVNQLLTQLDGVESLTGVFVIAATSRPDLLDPALLRPGRLDRQLYCGVPDQVSRYSILVALSSHLILDKQVDLKKISVSTKEFSGADIQSLLYSAQLFAVEEKLSSKKGLTIDKAVITVKHMEDALRSTKPSLSKQEVQKYDKIYAKFQGSKKVDNDNTIKKQKATLA